MFAKVFGQIFDSSIAEDYNCRRMFIDMLVLADSDGVVDMTIEAISRRTNVPLAEVEKYITELQEPDPASRSKKEDGRRLILVDPQRGWGWQVVNYRHYRQIRDEEARRSYFRDVKRKQRKKGKNVQDKSVDNGGRCQIIASASASSSSEVVRPKKEDFIEQLKALPAYKGIDVDREVSKMEAWLLTPKGKGRKLTKGFVVNWLNKIDVPISGGNGQSPGGRAGSWKKQPPLPEQKHDPEFQKKLDEWIARGRPLGEDPFAEKTTQEAGH